jgi:hypothetical protein
VYQPGTRDRHTVRGGKGAVMISVYGTLTLVLNVPFTFRPAYHRARWRSCKVLDFYSGAAAFECRAEHRIS